MSASSHHCTLETSKMSYSFNMLLEELKEKMQTNSKPGVLTMNVEMVRLLVGACITYGHLGYLNLEDHELVCLYEECLKFTSWYMYLVGDTENHGIQLDMLLAELKKRTLEWEVKLKVTEHLEIGDVGFLLMAKRYGMLNNVQKAIMLYEKAINISRKLGNKKTEKYACQGLVLIYSKLGNYHKMKEYSQMCVKLGKETRDKLFEGYGYLNLGIALSSIGNWKEGNSFFKKSIEIALEKDDKQLLATAYKNIADDYRELGEPQLAKEYLEKSLKMFKDLRDKGGESKCCSGLGSVCEALGKPKEAEGFYRKALDIFISTGNKESEGISYVNLANLYVGQYHRAIQYLDQALTIFKDIGNRTREGDVYMFLARVYTSIGKLEDSLENLNKSLAIATETGNKLSEINCYRQLGLVYLNLNKYEEALKYHEKYLDFACEIGDVRRKKIAYCDIGSVYLNWREPEKAIEYFEKSLGLDTAIQFPKLNAYAYFRLGEAYFQMKKYDEAIKYSEMSVAESNGDKRIAGRASYQLGLVYYLQSGEEDDEEKSQDAKEKSEQMLKEALQCFEWEFTQLKDLNDFKISLADIFVQAYKMLTKVLIERQKTDEALLVSDRGRARSLGDILVSKYGMTDERAPSQAPLDSTGLGSVLPSNKYCILFFAVGDKGLYAWVLTHQQRIFFANTSNRAVKVLQLEDGQSNIELDLQKTTRNFLNKFYMKVPTKGSENRTFDSIEEFKLPSVEGETRVYKTGMTSDERNIESDDEADENTDELEDLITLLITPVLQHLQHEEIVIIPDGHLFMVPFAALRDPTTGKYLSETKRIRISPSLATLKALQEYTGDHHSKTGALIVGNPDVGQVMFKGEKTTFSRLLSAEREAESIAKFLNAKPLTGSQATKEMVKQKLREGVAVIHIAAHGDEEHGHIALAPPPRTDATSIPEEQDYMLTMQEVQEIGVTAQLVVLSCCHSGRGDIKAEGVVGMSRAFLAAGARAVVASLWAIDDEATLSFMISFYDYLKMGKSASKSLRKAMNDIREEGYEDPRYWASFFLVGDDVTISG